MAKRRVAADILAAIIGVAFWFVLLPPIVDSSVRMWGELQPASLWFEVRDVHVFDSVETASPAIRVDWVIRRPFEARWVAEVEQQVRDGWLVTCTASGQNNYKPDAPLSLDVDLDWWTWPTKCRLPPGRYRVDTVWQLDLDWLGVKTVRNLSNAFEVRAK
jgi:hypothetical protein